MTLTLALDSATAVGSVAIGEAGRPAAELVFRGRRHAAATMPAIDAVLRLAGTRLEDVGRIVVADGPGSFTGLRIGWATVQGLLAGDAEIRVGTAPSLMAAAWLGAQIVDGPVAAAYDALRGEVFGAVYRFGPDGADTLASPSLSTLEQLRMRVAERPAAALGDGAVLYAREVELWTGRAPLAERLTAARAAALLALDVLPGAVRQHDDFTTATPNYGRLAEAQVRWERRHGRPLPHSPGVER